MCIWITKNLLNVGFYSGYLRQGLEFCISKYLPDAADAALSMDHTLTSEATRPIWFPLMTLR